MRLMGPLLLLVGIIPVVVVGGTLQETVAAEVPASELVQYYDAAWPLPDLTVINDSNRDQLSRATELVDYNKDDFAGTYVNQDSQLIVVTSSDRGQELAAEAFAGDPIVTIERQSFSLNTVNQLGFDLYRTVPALGEKIHKWGIDAATSSLRLGTLRALNDEDRKTIEHFAEQNALQIQVYVDESAERAISDSRLEDDSPYAGGFRYTQQTGSSGSTSGNGFCSGGFGYRSNGTNYMLTAGHCFERDTIFDYMWSTQGGACCTKKEYGGHRAKTTWNDGDGTVTSNGQYHGDLAIVNVDVANKATSSQIWWNGVSSPDKIPVTVSRTPTVGDPICINGVTSGADCGLTVQETNINWTYSDGDVVRNGDGATSTSDADCSQPGDSGGSIVYDHSGAETQATAEGIVSGHANQSIGCTQIFTGVEEATQAWGGGVKF